MKKRNGEIDILRAFFAIIILIYHSHIIYLKSANCFIRGYLGVEFFFLVSGYYLAKNAKTSDTSVTDASVRYVFNRFFSIISIYYYAVY